MIQGKLSMIKIFGITQCDTVRKARKWLENKPLEFEFIDFRKPRFNAEHIQSWLTTISFEDIVNKRSKAWKDFSSAQQLDLMSSQNLEILISTPTLIKRPILQTKTDILLGFKEADYQALFETEHETATKTSVN